jgi:hypothetical protein
MCALVFSLITVSTAAIAQKQICIGAVGGGDATTWNIQQPVLKAITTEASARGEQLKTQLLMSFTERQAKSEMPSLKCDYGLMINTNREWPTPKGAGLKTQDSKEEEKNPHPGSTAILQFILIDKSAKKLDKFETKIEMKSGATARDVQPELQEIIQEVANWTLDGTIPAK